jgi:outer membrane protein assembly factor BamE (lipoprotein component of BamABCDE complex)
MHYLNSLIVILTALYIFGCTEKTTYSGKIITEKDLSNMKILNKEQLIDKLGRPNYVDKIQNKYFYFTEKNKSKNFYNEKIEFSYLFIFELDKNQKIIKREAINLLDIDNNIYNKKETKSNIVKRGLIEKIFGGVGPNQLPNSP